MSTIGESAREESAAAGGADRLFKLTPLPGACFGATMRFPALSGAREAVAALEAEPEALGAEICTRGGFLLIPEMHQISDDPELLLRLSRLLGPEVEDYRNSYAFVNRRNLFNFHDTFPEIIQITNMPPIGTQSSPLPDPPLTEDGRIPVQHPHRTGWHTDQSLPAASARLLVVLCEAAGAARPGPDPVRRLDPCVCRAPRRDEGAN